MLSECLLGERKTPPPWPLGTGAALTLQSPIPPQVPDQAQVWPNDARLICSTAEARLLGFQLDLRRLGDSGWKYARGLRDPAPCSPPEGLYVSGSPFTPVQ